MKNIIFDKHQGGLTEHDTFYQSAAKSVVSQHSPDTLYSDEQPYFDFRVKESQGLNMASRLWMDMAPLNSYFGRKKCALRWNTTSANPFNFPLLTVGPLSFARSG